MYGNKNYSFDFTEDTGRPTTWLKTLFTSLNTALKKNFKGPLVFAFLFFVSLGFAVIFSFFGPLAGLIVLGVLVGIPVLFYSMINLRFGVIALFSFSFFVQGINRFSEGVPLGTIVDAFLLMMLIGLIYTKWNNNDLRLAKNPISYVVWAWIIYNGFELFNPMGSVQAWLYVIRGMAVLMILYFIILHAINGIEFCKKLINIWIALSLLGALYGLFQEFHGLLPFEKEWIHADEHRFKLFNNWGRYRIFSFFNDPSVFGVLMSFTGLLCITLVTGPFSIPYKIFLLLSAGAMFLAMVYAGTRTAFAILPAGFIFFSLLTFQKKTLGFSIFVMTIGAFIIFSDIRSLGPFLTTNNLERIRTTFNPDEDPSFQIRENNQSKIKPFIQSHPIGAGLGSTGDWSHRFNSGSPVAGFAPDSGYVRVAVELGWVGLALYCTFFAVILIVGIKNYYRIQNPELKAYMAALVSVVFSIVVANYPQQAIIQLPISIIFYAIMAMIIRLQELDKSTIPEN